MNTTIQSLKNTASTNKFIPQNLSFSYIEIPLKKISVPEKLFDKIFLDNEQTIDIDIINPLIVNRINDNKYEIIDGCKRFLRLKENGTETFLCAVSKIKISDKNSGFLRIKLNSRRKRPLTESVCLINWIKENTKPEEYKSAVKISGFDEKNLKKLERFTGTSRFILDLVDKNILHAQAVTDFSLL